MEIQLMCIGKTDRSIWSEAMAKYQYRLKHYIKFSVIYLPNIKISKKIDPIKVKTEEGKILLKKYPKTSIIISDDGYIITNLHIIDRKKEIS